MGVIVLGLGCYSPIGSFEAVGRFLMALTPTIPSKFVHRVSGSWIFCQTKHCLPVLEPKLYYISIGLTEDSITMHFRLGLFLLILIRKASTRHLWTYLNRLEDLSINDTLRAQWVKNHLRNIFYCLSLIALYFLIRARLGLINFLLSFSPDAHENQMFQD